MSNKGCEDRCLNASASLSPHVCRNLASLLPSSLLLHLPAHARLIYASSRLQPLDVAGGRLHAIQKGNKHRAYPVRRKDVEGRQGLFIGMRRVAQHAVVHLLQFYRGDFRGFVGRGVRCGLRMRGVEAEGDEGERSAEMR